MTFFTDSIVCCLRRVLRVCDHWRSTNSVCFASQSALKNNQDYCCKQTHLSVLPRLKLNLKWGWGSFSGRRMLLFVLLSRSVQGFDVLLVHSESNWTVYEASPLRRSVILPQTGLSSIDIILQQMDLIMHRYPSKLLRHEAKHLQRMNKQVHKLLNETLTFDVTL